MDEARGWLFFAASPKNATQRFLFRTKLDGKTAAEPYPGQQPIWNTFDCSPDGTWAVNTWSTFTTPPVVNLLCSRLTRPSASAAERPRSAAPPGFEGGVSCNAWFGRTTYSSGSEARRTTASQSYWT